MDCHHRVCCFASSKRCRVVPTRLITRRSGRCSRPGRHDGFPRHDVNPAGPAAERGRSATGGGGQMIGAIAGDIIGSVYEGKKQWLAARTADFHPLFSPKARFTDDTVLTVAVADALLHGRDLT